MVGLVQFFLEVIFDTKTLANLSRRHDEFLKEFDDGLPPAVVHTISLSRCDEKATEVLAAKRAVKEEASMVMLGVSSLLAAPHLSPPLPSPWTHAS